MALTKVGKEGIIGVSNSADANALFIDSSERVGVGATPNATFGSHLYAQGTPAANKPIISAYSQGNSNKAGLALFNDAGNRGIWTDSSNLLFTATYEGNSTEHMRIESDGDTFIGKSAAGVNTAGHELRSNGLTVHTVSGNTVMEINRTTNTGILVAFNADGSAKGSISTDGSSTAYNTSSDYRLKENVDYTWDATTRLKQLKPARFNFITDADTTVDGFLAHEAQAIVPNAVVGTKDEVDEDGVAVMQSMDNSKLVPLLVKTIQELEARLTAGGL